VNLATAKKERPSLSGGFSNDNDWLSQLSVGVEFYCTTGEGIYLTEYKKVWQQGPVVSLGQEGSDRVCYVHSSAFSKAYKLVHVYKEEDTT
jgi:hypothetical protein